jgi:uncharacterized protein YkwD
MIRIANLLRAICVPLAGLAVAAGLYGAAAPSAGAAAFAPMSGPEYQFLAELNADRVGNGLPAVSADGVLSGLARQRSQQLLSSGVFSHYDTAGHLVFSGMLNGIGFPYQFAGENLAENNSADLGQSLNMANTQLMNSPEHRANILNSRFNEAGVGIAGPGPNGQFYYTQIFAQTA